MPKFNRKANEGQMLIAILIALAVFAILTHALFTLISASYDLVSINRARVTAKHIAQEKIELARNVPYDDLGTVGGIPDGILAQEEIVNKNGLNFTITTSIIYIDDDFDGQGDDDLFPDYKRVRVEVSWEGLNASRKNPVVYITDVSPKISSAAEGTGILQILVLDAYGNTLSGADVTIVADTITPQVNLTQQTGFDGYVTLPGATPCVECYQVTVTKDGYSSEKTYSTSEIANPDKPHITVIEGKLSFITFNIDLLGTISLNTLADKTQEYPPQPNVNFILRGAKILGTDAQAQPVYKYEETHTTGENGSITLNELEWDTYTILMPTITSWDIAGSTPLIPIFLEPEENQDIDMVVFSHSDHSLYAIVKDTSQNLLENVYIKVSDGLGFEQEQITASTESADFGQAFFASLSELNYQVTATASGYSNYSGSLDVSGYTKNTIIMNSE